MIEIIEKKIGLRTIIDYRVLNENQCVYSEIIDFNVIKRRNNNKTYFLVYDSKMKSHTDIFQYLNVYKFKHSINSRTQWATALKLLLTYERIISKTLNDFTLVDFINLKVFLLGISVGGENISFNLFQTRSISTINSYLGIYRDYGKFIGLNNDVLFSKTTQKGFLTSDNYGKSFNSDKFIISEKTPTKVIEVPWYISIKDFEKILYEIRHNFTPLEESIVRLMFQCGLRIGEVLGLTFNDLVVEEIENDFIPLAYIRNRLSDNHDQKAKTCMNILSKQSYNTMEYKQKDYGYQRVVVPLDLLNYINDYIEEEHALARKKYSTNYFSSAIADRIAEDKDENFYIFINSLGRRLTAQTWNIRLRKIFRNVGIQLDESKRQHNLNHRFRHGFAMYHVMHLQCKELQLMELMRHKSLASVSKYFKPTLSDAIRVKTKFEESMLKDIPNLKGGRNQ